MKKILSSLFFVFPLIAAAQFIPEKQLQGVTSQEPEQKFSVISDSLHYAAFPSIAFDRNNLAISELVYKESDTHAGDGRAIWTKSYDGFTKFTTPDTITVDGLKLTCSVIMIGKGNGTRHIIAWGRGGVYDTIFFAKNDDYSKNFISAGYIVAAANGLDWTFSFAKTLQMHGDTLFMGAYGLRTGQTKTDAEYYKTYNNGDSWTYGGIVIPNSSLGSSTPSEMDWEIYSQGATVATTKIVAIARDDFYKGYHLQAFSTNGGSSWTQNVVSQGDFAFHDVNAGAIVDNSFPCMLLKNGDWLYAILGIRNTLANGGFSFRIFRTLNPESINAWEGGTTTPTFSTISRSIGSFKGQNNDWGYGWFFLTPAKEMRVVYYEPGVNYKPGVNAVTTIIKTMPVIGLNQYEAYNDANQSVTSGTETKVLFPKPWFDSEKYYVSVDGTIYLKTNGYYSASAQFLIDTSSVGNYREAKMLLIDWGAEAGSSPQYSTVVLSKVTIAPSTNSKFCWVELHAQFDGIAGQELRITFTHDKGSALNILNSVTFATSDGARLKLKKLN